MRTACTRTTCCAFVFAVAALLVPVEADCRTAYAAAEHDRGGVTFDFAALSDRLHAASVFAPTNLLVRSLDGRHVKSTEPQIVPLPHARGGLYRVVCRAKVRQDKVGDCAILVRLGSANPDFAQSPFRGREDHLWCKLVRRGDRFYPVWKSIRAKPGETHALVQLCLEDAEAELEGAAFFEAVEDPSARPPEFTLSSSFSAYLDGEFHVSQGQVGSVLFECRKSAGLADFDRSKLTFRVVLPRGIEFLDATLADRSTLKVERRADGGSVASFRPNAAYAFGSEAYVLVAATGALGEAGEGWTEAVYGDRTCASAHLRYVIAPRISARTPRRYANGCFVETAFDMSDPAACARYVKFMREAGCTWLIPAAATNYPSLALWRANGIRRVTPDAGPWCRNGYQVGDGNVPEDERFVSGKDGYLGLPKPGTLMCPLAVAEETEYFRTVAAPLIASYLKGTDGLWSNWEPWPYRNRGCVCDRCRKAFAAYVGKPEAEIAKDWPASVLKGGRYAEEGGTFRSICHGKLVKTLNRCICAATGGETSCGLLPGIHFGQMLSTWRLLKPMPEARPEHFADGVRWINLWGPYVAWPAWKAYVRERGKFAAHFVAARDMRAQVDRDYGAKKPKILSAPQGAFGGWNTQPANFEMEFDAFFFNRIEACAPWRFPVGADARYWRGFARATDRAARYEDIVWDGEDVSSAVKATPVAEFAAPIHEVLARLPNWHDVAQLQTVAYRKAGLTLVAAFNFWQEGEAFFTLSVKGLAGAYEIVSDDGVRWAKAEGDAAWTGEELAKGVFLSVGAARVRAFEIRPVGATGPTPATREMTTARLRAAYAARREELAAAATRDREAAKHEMVGVTEDD